MADNPNETPRSTFDRNDTESEVAFFKALFRMYANSVQTCIPVIVLDRENEDGFIKVKPIIKSKVFLNGRTEGIDRPNLFVRPYKIFHGGFTISIPVFKGDTGYVIVCDREANTAINANQSILEEDQGEEGGKNEGARDEDSVDSQRYSYGFFIPCSWFRSETGERASEFGEDSGKYKDSLLIANASLPDDDKFACLSMNRDSEIEIKSGNSIIKIDKDKVKIEKPDASIEVVDGKVSATVSSMKMDVVKNSVDIYQDGDDRKVHIDTNEIRSEVKFREVKVVAGTAERMGDSVSIPLRTIYCLCDEPTTSGSITFSVKDET